MIKKTIISLLLLIAWLFFATLFYKTVCMIVLFMVWRSYIKDRIPEKYRKWSMCAVWFCLIMVLWIAMPRYRINTIVKDRIRLVYVNQDGQVHRPPISQYLLNVLLPEEEIVNAGIKGVRYTAPLIQRQGIGESLIQQAKEDIKAGKIRNFFSPYRRLGLNNPMSGVYPQVFNEKFGTDYRAVYICNPKQFHKDQSYPLVVFCHGYLGNWQLYQGLWKDLSNAIVLSIGTKGLDGIFKNKDIDEIFTFYIPMLEQMGYHIDRSQIHLMGLSNGGSAIVTAMHSNHAKDFKSITTISCNLESLQRVPCQVNLIGGGKDKSSQLMPSQYNDLKRMGVDADILFDENDNHYIMVNQREEILDFLNRRLELQIAPDTNK